MPILLTDANDVPDQASHVNRYLRQLIRDAAHRARPKPETNDAASQTREKARR